MKNEVLKEDQTMRNQMIFLGFITGYMIRFFYKRIHKTTNLFMIPLYFLFLLFLGFIFVAVLGIVIYINMENDF